jgi:nucleoside-diphosphate-sugar epimerase
VGSRSRITHVPYEEAYDDGFEELGRRTPDVTALHELTGWRPRRDLDQALDDVIAFQRAELALESKARFAAERNGSQSELGVRATG